MSEERDPNNPKKEYTGVWIPKAVMECKELSPIEKIAYGEIACFEECYASNAWLAKRIGRSETVASRSVAHLIELGFVENCGFNGRFRVVKVCQKRQGLSKTTNQTRQKRQARLCKNDKADYAKMTNIDKSKEQRVEQSLIIEDKSSMAQEPKETYGNDDINWAFDLWEQMLGVPQKNCPKNRNACYNLLRNKKMGKQWIENSIKILIVAKRTKFVRKEVSGIANYADLQANWEYLWDWGKSQAESAKNNYVTDQI